MATQLHPESLDAEEVRAVLQVRTTHRITNLMNLVHDDLDTAHERIDWSAGRDDNEQGLLEMEESFHTLVEAAYRLLDHARTHPTSPLPPSQLAELRSMIEAFPQDEETDGEEEE